MHAAYMLAPDGFSFPSRTHARGLWLIFKRRILKTGKITVCYGQNHTTSEGDDFGQ